jgi:hypothetical protein
VTIQCVYFRAWRILFAVLVLAACSGFTTINIEKEVNGVLVRCEMQKVERKTEVRAGATEKMWLWGTVAVENVSNATIKYDVRRYRLIANGQTTSAPYISSVASVLMAEKFLHPGEKSEHRVYWILDTPVSEQDLRKFQLDMF